LESELLGIPAFVFKVNRISSDFFPSFMSLFTGCFNWIFNEIVHLHFCNLTTGTYRFWVDVGNLTAVIMYIYRHCMRITLEIIGRFDTNAVNRLLNRLKVKDDRNIGCICDPLVVYVIGSATIFKKTLLIMVLLIICVSSTDCRFIVCDAKVDQIINKCFHWFGLFD